MDSARQVSPVGRSGAPGQGDRTVGRLGEFGLIDEVTARFSHGPQVLLGPGDDAAVLAAPDGRVVVTTDVLVEGRHFRRDWSSPQDVGHRAAAANLADIAAMGAVPTGLVVGLAAPGDLPVEWATGLADGLAEECALVGVSVVGGDVVGSDVVVVSVTALGDLQGRAPVTRSGARAGDAVAVAGRLGWAAAGLALLSRGFRTARTLIDAHRRPEVPYDQGPAAALAGATAMCDVSDGLLQDLGHVATASGVDVELDVAAFDVPARMAEVAASMGVDPLRWVLTGGDDHALAATFPSVADVPEGWRVVGRVTEPAGEQPRVRVGADGAAEALAADRPGWDHFR